MQETHNEKNKTTIQSMVKKKNTLYLSPLILTICIIIVDQITKYLVIKYLPVLDYSPESIKKITNDFLWIIHVQNRGAMFSMGSEFKSILRLVTIFILPILLILYMLSIIIFSNWDKNIRWVAAGIVGGGIGNMIDRVIRPEGVVDFISVKFYGLFGMERWPTFNVADSSIVISMLTWILLTIINIKKEKSLSKTASASSYNNQ